MLTLTTTLTLTLTLILTLVLTLINPNPNTNLKLLQCISHVGQQTTLKHLQPANTSLHTNWHVQNDNRGKRMENTT